MTQYNINVAPDEMNIGKNCDISPENVTYIILQLSLERNIWTGYRHQRSDSAFLSALYIFCRRHRRSGYKNVHNRVCVNNETLLRTIVYVYLPRMVFMMLRYFLFG